MVNSLGETRLYRHILKTRFFWGCYETSGDGTWF
jgi:hypothetical protein